MMEVRERRDDLVSRVPRLQALFVGLLLVVAASYWFIQVVQGDHYRELAENNRLRKLPIKAPRGLIYDREGRLLVRNVPSYNLYLDRSRSEDLERDLGFAALILGRPPEELREALARGPAASVFQPVLVAEDLSLPEVAKFLASSLEHPAFEIEVGHLRLNLHGPFTAHALGYLRETSQGDLVATEGSYAAGDLVGRTGVEETFDRRLRGENGERVVTVDSRGRLREESGYRPARPGEDLRLTLDLELQQEAARYFQDRVGAAVAIDPDSGGILVMVSAPSYDPNLFARRLDRTQWRSLLEAPHHPLQNRTIQNTYSPGSVFKLVVALAGLSEGLIQPSDTTYCSGSTRIYNRRFRCWKRPGHGTVNLKKAIRESCDVYFYHLGQKLGIERIARYARALGLGRATGIDITGEKEGLVPDPEWKQRVRSEPWYPGETISVAIGQGPLLVTPLQMATLMATVANDGRQPTPHLAAAEAAAAVDLKLHPANLGILKDALWAAVNDSGTGARAAVPGVRVYGKTGTVQVVEQSTWMESEDLPFDKRDHAWFASFAEAGGRKLAVAVFVEHGGKGSQAAAPLAKRLYEIYFRDAVTTGTV